MKVLVPLARGFEEIEAVTIIDVLRRADIDVTSLCLDSSPVTGSHNIPVITDVTIDTVNAQDYQCIVLPGGMPGSSNLKEDKRVISIIQQIYGTGGYVAALCAAPIVLAQAGILKGKKATCYPGFEKQLEGAEYIPEPVIVDGKIITGKGPGCAIPFALKIVEILSGKDKSVNLKDAMQVYWMQ